MMHYIEQKKKNLVQVQALVLVPVPVQVLEEVAVE
jgi:hypothetical protein